MIGKLRYINHIFIKSLCHSIVSFFIIGMVLSILVIIIEPLVGSLSFLLTGIYKGFLSHVETTNEFLINKDYAFSLSKETWKLKTDITILNSFVNWLINFQFTLIGNIRLFFICLIGFFVTGFISIMYEIDIYFNDEIQQIFTSVSSIVGLIWYAPLAYGGVMTIVRVTIHPFIN